VSKNVRQRGSANAHLINGTKNTSTAHGWLKGGKAMMKATA